MKPARHSPLHLREVMEGFQIWGDFLSGVPYGTGHINDTYKVMMSVAGTTVPYLLQRINHGIFSPTDKLMENIWRVTEHQRKKLRQQQGRNQDLSRQVLTVIPSRDGLPYVRDHEANWWRLYLFIEGARTYDVLQGAEQAFRGAQAFAAFQDQLADLELPRLYEIIPDFHNTVKRLEALDAAVRTDVRGRVGGVGAELEFLERRRERCGRLLALQAAGELPERITHNDTKINNVMLDDATGEGVCVIDLDTVMPGLSLYDFGDMVRTATAAAAEDEPDLEKVHCRLEMFEALVRGYLSRAAFLLPMEIGELAFSGQLITMTIGIRFLTDYLAGDTYFRIARPNHNLERCRTQFSMVRSMERQEEAMRKIVCEVAKGR